jgi:hypothetical protein
MLPNMTQRLVIVLAIFGAGFVMLGLARSGAPVDGSGPYSLLYAAAPTEAIVRLAVFSIGVVCFGAVAGAFGNPIGGVFVVAMAMLFPAIKGGGVDLWLRVVESERDYWRLVMETHLWAAWAAIVIPLTMKLACVIQNGLPETWYHSEEELDELSELGLSGGAGGGAGGGGAGEEGEQEENEIRQVPQGTGGGPPGSGFQMIFGALLTAVVGVVLTPLFVRSPDPQQVAWGLVGAYLIAGVLGHQTFSGGHPVGVLLGPFIGGAFWYAIVASDGAGGASVGGGVEGNLLDVYFAGDLARGALVMPVYYASAGLAGAAVGVGWSQVLLWSKELTERLMAKEEAGRGG